jgi:hypothetical protein
MQPTVEAHRDTRSVERRRIRHGDLKPVTEESAVSIDAGQRDAAGAGRSILHLDPEKALEHGLARGSRQEKGIFRVLPAPLDEQLRGNLLERRRRGSNGSVDPFGRPGQNDLPHLEFDLTHAWHALALGAEAPAAGGDDGRPVKETACELGVRVVADRW